MDRGAPDSKVTVSSDLDCVDLGGLESLHVYRVAVN